MEAEDERTNDLALGLANGDMTQRHMDARISALEAVCIALSSQSAVSEGVVARLREILSSCRTANQSKPHPDWPLQEHHLRRLMQMIEDRIGLPDKVG